MDNETSGDSKEIWPATDLLPGWAIQPVDWAAYHRNGRGQFKLPIVRPEELPT